MLRRLNQHCTPVLLCLVFFLWAEVVHAGEQESPPTQPGRAVRVAAISFVPTKFDLQANVQQLERAFRQAQTGGAKIAVAPEGVLEGYVVNEVIHGQAKPEAMREVALKLDDPTIEHFRTLARELNMCLVFGFAEKIGPEIFNCAVFIDEAGTICGKHHKMQLAEGYHAEWWFNRLGSRSRAFETPYGRCGILICNERWNPALGKILAADGAQFFVIPSYGSCSKTQDEAVLQLGKDSGVPIVEANVGLSMLVDNNNIVALDRHQNGITFGEIHVPQGNARKTDERDRLEREFLTWREGEMKIRFEKTVQRVSEKAKLKQPQP